MPKAKSSYSAMKIELDVILLDLQRDDINVDEALISYERGLELLKSIEVYIKQADNKVSEIKAKYKEV